MKKNWLFVTAILCMATMVSRGALGASGSTLSVTDSPQKKERKIKIRTIKDGNMTEKDSTIATGTDNQVFVVGSSMSVKADSMYHDLGNGYDQKSVTVTVTDEGDKQGKGTTYTYSIGDTLKSDVSGKAFRLGNAKRAFIMRDDSGENVGMPAMSSGRTSFRVVGRQAVDPYGFRPDDPSIVSYRKKEMGKGLEKITIIRKKAVEKEKEN